MKDWSFILIDQADNIDISFLGTKSPFGDINWIPSILKA